MLAATLLGPAPAVYFPRYVITFTGDWGLRFLVLTLAVTPVRRLTGWHGVIRLRRPLGLAAFCYSAAHVLLWGAIDWSFAPRPMLVHATANPFYASGTVAIVALIPLAATSNRASMARLGRRWQTLQRLTYLAVAAVLAHFWLRGPVSAVHDLKWIAIVAVLLGVRLIGTEKAKGRHASTAPGPDR
jgi:sulfoxide reductase heme-binding subunit YedZ